MIKDARAIQVEHFVSTIDKAPPSLADATTVLQELQHPSSPFSKPDIDLISAAINKSVSMDSSIGKRGCCASQTHLHMYNYMTKSDWEVLVDEKSPVESRIGIIVDRAMSIGLLFPSGKTCVVLLSMLAVVGREQWSAEVLKQYLGIMKNTLRAQRKVKLAIEGFKQSLCEAIPCQGIGILRQEPIAVRISAY